MRSGPDPAGPGVRVNRRTHGRTDKNESPLYRREFFFFRIYSTNPTKFLPLHFVKDNSENKQHGQPNSAGQAAWLGNQGCHPSRAATQHSDPAQQASKPSQHAQPARPASTPSQHYLIFRGIFSRRTFFDVKTSHYTYVEK